MLAVSVVFIIMLFAGLSVVPGDCVKVTHVSSPGVVDPRDAAVFGCLFDMEDTKMYSFKWYKDDMEFFRYVPKQDPQVTTFPVPGVNVVYGQDACNDSYCEVTLTGFNLTTSPGMYLCEVSSEAPTFDVGSAKVPLIVQALPRGNPSITGLKSVYFDGEIMTVDCKAPRAYPPPVLQFFVNEEPVPSRFIVSQTDSAADNNGLIVRTLSVNMPMDHSILIKPGQRRVQLRCELTSPRGSPGKRTVIREVIVRPNATTFNSDPHDGLNNEKLQEIPENSRTCEKYPTVALITVLCTMWLLNMY